MAAITLVIGSDARGDGFRGEVRGLILDPAAGTVTHLVVEPKGRRGLARLVPLDIADATTGEIQLRCTEAEFKNLGPAEETVAEFVVGYHVPVQVVAPGWRDTGGPVVAGEAVPRIPEQETMDVVPAGEVEEHRGDHVRATDGDLGHVHALRIDPDSHQVTHVLLKQGHWGARQDVAIPFGKVAGLDDGIRLSITRQQVHDLPPS